VTNPSAALVTERPARPNPKPATVAHEHDRRVKRTLRLLLSGLAACRKGELEMLRWELVDLARSLITVPKSKVRVGGAKARGIPHPPGLAPRGSRRCTRARAP
jgi:integrase